MKIGLKGFITCKGAESYSDCADNYAYNIDYHKFAISDGVSKSFFPKIWSEILVENYVNFESWKDSEFMDSCQSDWKKSIDKIVNKPDIKWYTKNAYNRQSPALATFVSLQIYEKEKVWESNSIGDSFLFFVPKKMKNFDSDVEKLSSKPEPIIFDNFPDYFTSVGDKHNGEPRSIEKRKLVEGTFILLTDALAEWFLNEKSGAIEEIAKWENQSEFENFVINARANSKLSDDDSAILIIEVKNLKGSKIEYVKKKVSSLKELIKKDSILLKNDNELEVKSNSIDEVYNSDNVIEDDKSIKSEIENEQSIQPQPKKGTLDLITHNIEKLSDSMKSFSKKLLPVKQKGSQEVENENTLTSYTNKKEDNKKKSKEKERIDKSLEEINEDNKLKTSELDGEEEISTKKPAEKSSNVEDNKVIKDISDKF